MAVVYLAERADEQFEKRVALKVVKRGMDTDEVLRRFRHERQILASLDHPNIARLLDGGATADGRPYLVMEYIEGEPIDAYCDRRGLGIRERLDLFRAVCNAVQHAYQRLVVHRDIKPSNILVTEAGEPKLLDFGIAKLLDESASDATPRTRTGVRLLTPEYASPEQVRGAPVTTASDVYALGMVLYQLLCGRRPYEVARGLAPADIERVVFEQDPVPPSVAVGHGGQADAHTTPAELAWRRGMSPDALRRRLRGDLDTIALKALAKAPERRYGSALQLAEDIGRHLAGLPVTARPDSIAYRAAKFIRRHRTSVAAGALASLSLVAGLGAAVWQAGRAAHERDAALEVSAFLEGLFQAPDPFEATTERLDTLRVRDILDRGAARVRADLGSQPDLQPRMLNVLGGVYSSLALYDDAASLLSEARDIRARLDGPDHERTAAVQHRLANALRDRGDFAAADSLFRAALATRRARLGPRHPDVAETLNDLGELLRRANRFDEADSLLRVSLDILRATTASPALVSGLNTIANVLQSKGDFAEAERYRREAVDVSRRLHGDGHPQVAVSLGNLATLLVETERLDEAEPVLRQSLDIYRATLGEDHPSTLSVLNTLALLLNDKRDYDAAEAIAREALAGRRRVHGDRHPGVFTALNTLAITLYNRRDYEGAEPFYREALALSRDLYPDGRAQTVVALTNLAALLRDAGRHDEAEPLLREALDLGRRILGDQYPSVGLVAGNLASLLQARRQFRMAEPYFREAEAIAARALPADHPRVLRARVGVAENLTAQRRFQEAEEILTATLQVAERLDANAPPTAALRERTLRALVKLYTRWRRPDQAAVFQARLSGGA